MTTTVTTLYQYQEIDLNGGDSRLMSARQAHENRMDRLNRHGADGWQLVAVMPNLIAIMMRTIEEPKPKRAYTRRQTTPADEIHDAEAR